VCAQKFNKYLALGLFLLFGTVWAEDLSFKYSSLILSGIVINEKSEHYDYLLQIEKHEDRVNAKVLLLNAQTKEVVFSKESEGSFKNYTDWRASDIFLKFNPINATWVFGLENPDKSGFNFKVDVLKQMHNPTEIQELSDGVAMLVNQTGQLSGYLRLNAKNQEEFVTSDTSWFRQITSKNDVKKAQNLSGLLCRFDDGGGFYTIQSLDADAIRGTASGWFDAAGNVGSLSQFINIKKTLDGLWHIDIPAPKQHFVLQDILMHDGIVTGFFSENNKTGFCMLNQREVT
jgi:hypothetical protein